MREDAKAHDPGDGFFHLKLAHVQLNRSELKRKMGKRLEKAEQKFLDGNIVDGVGPWGNVSGVA